MLNKLSCGWSGMIGTLLLALGLLGLSPTRAASAPRLLWNTEPQHG